jgi:hypothetical protein
MRRSPGPRKKFVALSDSLNHHLNMYAVAAGAAGVGMLALAQPADAKVVYTPANKHIAIPYGPLYIDLNHDGINDFEISVRNGGSSGFSTVAMYVFGANRTTSNAIWKGKGTCFNTCASALPAGVRVGGTNNFSKNANDMANIFAIFSGGRWVYGYRWPWAKGGNGVIDRYLGLKFSVGGEIHYGWARFNVKVHLPRGAQNIYATLTGYAYETVPNRPIVTGATSSSVNEDEAPQASLRTPETPPTSLGLLALGAPGLEIWRREGTNANP